MNSDPIKDYKMEAGKAMTRRFMAYLVEKKMEDNSAITYVKCIIKDDEE